MNPLRRWILGLAVGCFAAGVGVGLVVPSMVSASGGGEGTDDPNEEYVEWMTSEYGLDARQQKVLRVVLERTAQEEFEVFRQANIDQLPESLHAEVIAVRRRQTARVRAMLSAAQQEQFDNQDPSRSLGEVR